MILKRKIFDLLSNSLSSFFKEMYGDQFGEFVSGFNPFAPGDFAEKRVLKLVEWFSGHCRAIKS